MKCLKVLFLCSGNDARSQFSEYILKKRNNAHIEAYSASTLPNARPHSLVEGILEDEIGVDISGLRCKSIEEFRSVEFDIVITLCERERDFYQSWKGEPVFAHWEVPDPSAFEGTDEEVYRQFNEVAMQIYRRIGILTSLPALRLKERADLERAVQEIGGRAKVAPDAALA